MFKILDGRAEFYQWDIDRKLVVEDASITEVHFCNKTDNCSLVCEVYEEDGLRVVNVPNILLQTDWRINVYGYDVNYTKHSACFGVVARTQPADYIYKETEVMTFSSVLERAEQAAKGAESYCEAAQLAVVNANTASSKAAQYANDALVNAGIADSASSNAIRYANDARTEATYSANAAIRAEASAKEAQEAVEGMANIVDDLESSIDLIANAVRGTASGETVVLDDVSPFTQFMKVNLASKNLTSRVLNNAVAVGDGINNNIFGATGGRVPKPDEVDAYEENTQYTVSLKVTPKDITYSATGRFIFGTATYTDGTTAYFDLVGNKNCNVEPNTLLSFTTAPNKTVTSIDLRKHSRWTGGTITLNDLQIEKGLVATEYTPHIDKANVTLTDGTNKYKANEDGTVSGVESVFPTTTLTTDTVGALISVEYNKDTNKVIQSLVNAIISLGGNI